MLGSKTGPGPLNTRIDYVNRLAGQRSENCRLPNECAASGVTRAVNLDHPVILLAAATPPQLQSVRQFFSAVFLEVCYFQPCEL